MDNKNVRNDDDYGGVDSNMDLSEEDRECSILNEERKIEEDLKQAEKEDSEKMKKNRLLNGMALRLSEWRTKTPKIMRKTQPE